MPRTPRYVHPAPAGGHRRRLFTVDLLENLFFGATAVFGMLFAAIIVRDGYGQWRVLFSLVAFWAVMAYLTLPRVHRVLTGLYVPDYFIGRARTTEGLLGDPVNLAFVGEEQRLHEAMRRAGWVEADPINLTTSWRIVESSLRRRSYAQAPVSPLVLFGRIQDFAYQQEVDGNPAQRHHVRFWRCPPGWLLPGGHRVEWLASGTYDRAVGLSWFTFQVTHRIDRDIDVERDYIVDTIRHAHPEVEVRVIEDFSTGYHHRNGGGDAISTDGDLPVVDVRPIEVAGPRRDEGEQSDDKDDLLHDVGRRPFSVVAAGLLAAASILLGIGVSLHEVLAATPADLAPDEQGLIRWVASGIVALTGAATALLAWLTYQGSGWARLAMMVLLSFSLAISFAAHLSEPGPAVVGLIGMSLDLFTVYALTSRSARDWTRRHGRRRRRDRPSP